MAGLPPGPGDPVGSRRGRAVLPGLLFFPRSPEVQVVLQQLPQQVPAPLVQVLLELAGGHPGCGGTSEIPGQLGEHAFRDGERITAGNRVIRFHEGSSSCEVRDGQHLRT